MAEAGPESLHPAAEPREQVHHVGRQRRLERQWPAISGVIEFEPIGVERLPAKRDRPQAVRPEDIALLADDEVMAVQERARWIVEHPVLPADNTGRRYPWPLV